MKFFKIAILFAVLNCFSEAPLANEDDHIKVVNFIDMQDYWIVDHWPDQRRATMKEKKAGNPGCVSVSFVIESDGTTSSHQAVASFPNNAHDERIIHMLKRIRFNPSEGNITREPIHTVMIMNMSPIVRRNGVQNEDSAELSRKVGGICERKVDAWFSQMNHEKPLD